MKQHITYQQWKELTTKRWKELTTKHQIQTGIFHHISDNNYPWDTINIGYIIELLDNWLWEIKATKEGYQLLLRNNKTNEEKIIKEFYLCDALWEAYKYRLTQLK